MTENQLSHDSMQELIDAKKIKVEPMYYRFVFRLISHTFSFIPLPTDYEYRSRGFIRVRRPLDWFKLHHKYTFFIL